MAPLPFTGFQKGRSQGRSSAAWTGSGVLAVALMFSLKFGLNRDVAATLENGPGAACLLGVRQLYPIKAAIHSEIWCTEHQCVTTSKSSFNSSFTFTVPPPTETGVMPKSVCFS